MEKYLQEAIDIVKAQASVCTMTEEDIIAMIGKLSAGIKALSEGAELPDDADVVAMDPAKAIKEKSITCVKCGKSFKLLTKKHLASHGLTPDEYRESCGYKKGTPLVCKSLQRERRKKMRSMRLWERRGK